MKLEVPLVTMSKNTTEKAISKIATKFANSGFGQSVNVQFQEFPPKFLKIKKQERPEIIS